MFYHWFLIVSALELLFEAAISIRNSSRLLRKGAIEIGGKILPLMVAVYIVMYIGSYFEYRNRLPQSSDWWISGFVTLFLAAKSLKFWAISALGEFWTMRVLILPESRVVRQGPYRWIRHPNYVSVLMELAAVPMLGKCMWTFLIVFFPFLALLYFRIKAEEAALVQFTDYKAEMMHRRRFVP